MPPLGIFLHHAAQSTLPDSWPLYAATSAPPTPSAPLKHRCSDLFLSIPRRYCHSVANVNDTSLDCSIEEGAVVHAYSTIAAGFDHANFGIDTLLPAVVPHPSAPGASSKTRWHSLS